MFKKLAASLIAKNSKTHKPSYTTTAFIIGITVVNLKLLLAGVDISHYFKMSEFSGIDYSASIGALGALYISNKHVGNIQANKIQEKKDLP